MAEAYDKIHRKFWLEILDKAMAELQIVDPDKDVVDLLRNFDSNDHLKGDAKIISRLQRKTFQMKITIDHLHDRLAAVKSSNRNKSSQIARLNEEIEELAEENRRLNQLFCDDGLLSDK